MTCALLFLFFFFLMIRRPPRSTLDRSSAASDVYKRQLPRCAGAVALRDAGGPSRWPARPDWPSAAAGALPVSYTHLRAHETVLDLVCRLLLEKKKNKTIDATSHKSDNRENKAPTT